MPDGNMLVKIKAELELSVDDWSCIIGIRSLAPDESVCKMLSDVMREGLKAYRKTFDEFYLKRTGSERVGATVVNEAAECARQMEEADEALMEQCPICKRPIRDADMQLAPGEPVVYTYSPCGCQETGEL